MEEQVEEMDPLDQALANVIQNLIQINHTSDREHDASSVEPRPGNQPDIDRESLKLTQDTPSHSDTVHCACHTDHTDIDVHEISSEALKIINSVSVFSIGPFPESSESVVPRQLTPVFGHQPDKNCQEESNSLEDKKEVGTTLLPFIPVVSTSLSLTTLTPTSLTSATSTSLQLEATSTSLQSEAEVMTPSSLKSDTEAITVSSTQPSSSKATRTPEEVLAARAARLKRLEEQADWLMKKMSATSQRGSVLSTRLEELHEAYAEPPVPPPLPDVLPTVTLPTCLDFNIEVKKIKNFFF